MDGFQAFSWECKDYADGWIRYFDEQEALAYQRDTGCIIRVVYRARTEQPQDDIDGWCYALRYPLERLRRRLGNRRA